jgi:IS30 family transposase
MIRASAHCAAAIALLLCSFASTFGPTPSRSVTVQSREANRANDADQHAWNAALRPKRRLLAANSELCDVVASKLILDWSPEQIAGWL